MGSFSGNGGQQVSWVKVPIFCLVALTVAFAMDALIAPLVTTGGEKVLSNDPSREFVQDPLNVKAGVVPEVVDRAKVLSNDPSRDVVRDPLNVKAGVVPEVVDRAKIEEAEVHDDVELEPAAMSNSSNGTQVVLQLPSQQEMECNLFQGKWVQEASRKTLYTFATCPVLSKPQNCPGNGRPDSGFLNWKWKPNGCQLADFDPVAFLELMRGKTLAFAGDSLTRNQYESLLCALWQVVTPVVRGTRMTMRYEFREYGFTAVRFWSTWLVDVTTDAIDIASNDLSKLHLDTLDSAFSKSLASIDVFVVATGHWWGTKPAVFVNGSSVVGWQKWWNNTSPNPMDSMTAFAISMKMALKSILAHPEYKGLTILRTYSPDHYEGGAWNTGGSCTGKTQPLTDAELPRNEHIDAVYALQMAAVKEANATEERLLVMDVVKPFLHRADGHPGPYRNSDPNKVVTRGKNGRPPPQDCLHWCMPGPIDTWNEYLLAMLRRHYRKKQ